MVSGKVTQTVLMLTYIPILAYRTASVKSPARTDESKKKMRREMYNDVHS